MRTTLSKPLYWFACVLLSGCSLFGTDDGVPAYVIVPALDFTTDYQSEGSSSVFVSELWVFADARMIGAYELPASIPVLKEGLTELQFFAGIKNNDNPRSRIIYPFFNDHKEVVDLSPLRFDTIIPEFRYLPNATIRLVDDFESANVFSLDFGSQGTMERTADPDLVYEGSRSLQVNLSESEVIARIKTNEQQYDLPQNRLCFLEVNFRSNNSVAVGLEATGNFGQQRDFTAVISPREGNEIIAGWRKLYIDLSGITSIYPNASFEVVFECIKDPGNTTAAFWLDNVKIVHF